MRAVPIRGADGKIVDFVDPRALETPEEETNTPQETNTTEEAPEPTARRTRALRSTERKPLGDLLGTSTTVPHANRSFTTGMVAGLLGALIVAALIVLSRTPATTSTSAPATVATRAPSTASARTSTPTSAATVPAVVVAPPTLGRALVAYAAPDGAVMGAISADRAISLTGTFGSAWVQIETEDSGPVWVKQVDLPNAVLDPVALASLPDLAPPPTATALPSPTIAPVARPVVPPAPASVPASNANAPVQRCTPDRVVAIVEQGATQVASCISLADAQESLPDSTVIARSAEEAQAFYGDQAAVATAFAQPLE